MSYFKRFLIFALSVLLIFAQPVAYAASPNGWAVTPADIIIGAAGNTVTAIKGAGASALQSTIKHAPTVGNIGKKIIKGAGGLAVAYAVAELLGAGVDWVLDPANNSVTYTKPDVSQPNGYYRIAAYPDAGVFSTAKDACIEYIAIEAARTKRSYVFSAVQSGSRGQECWARWGAGAPFYLGSLLVPTEVPKEEKGSIPISTVAAKVVSNSAAGHAPSQELIKTVIIDDVNAGVLDTPLNINAVPVADAPPVNPPHDPTQPVPPFDPSSIIAAIKSVMGAVVNMSGILGAKIDLLMIDLGLKQAETIEAITAGTGDIVAANDRTGAQVAAIAAAIADIEGNTLDGKVINDAVDRVIAEGKTNTSDIVAAIEAIEGNTLDGKVINDAIDRVIANDNANAQSAADAAEIAEAARAADAQEAKEAADAKAAADAAALEWAKEAPEAPTDTGVVVEESVTDFDTDKKYIEFSGSCPSAYTASLSVMGNDVPFSFDYAPICTVMSYLKPFIVGAGYLTAAYIIAGYSRGGSKE